MKDLVVLIVYHLLPLRIGDYWYLFTPHLGAPPYDFILDRIVKEGIFSGLIPLFSDIGYDVQFSSYEKLALRKARDFDFYDDLKKHGIQPDDMFPEPLILYFSLKRKK